MNELSLRILRYIRNAGGSVRVSELRQLDGYNSRAVGALCSGHTPNCIVEGNIIKITERGLLNTEEFEGQHEGSPETPHVEEDVFDDLFGAEPEPPADEPEQHSDTNNLLDITIDRNENVLITCKVSERLAKWMKANGRVENVLNTRGSNFAHNWDCKAETNFINVKLGGMDDRGDFIITDMGINPCLLKIAGAQPNHTWKVKYKGLVSKEQLLSYAEKLKIDCNKFYVNYIKPVKIRIQLTVLE